MAMTRLLCADSAASALVSYRQMTQAGAHAMVGAARSAVSMPLAQLGALDVMPQCSYWSSSPTLSDTQLYPYCASLLVCPESHKSVTATCNLAAYAFALRRMPSAALAVGRTYPSAATMAGAAAYDQPLRLEEHRHPARR